MAKIISYDLRAPGRDYKTLYLAIASYQKVAKLTESCWAIDSPDTCVVIRDRLKGFVDSNDRLFVASLSGEAAWTSAISKDDDVKKVLTGT